MAGKKKATKTKQNNGDLSLTDDEHLKKYEKIKQEVIKQIQEYNKLYADKKNKISEEFLLPHEKLKKSLKKGWETTEQIKSLFIKIFSKKKNDYIDVGLLNFAELENIKTVNAKDKTYDHETIKNYISYRKKKLKKKDGIFDSLNKFIELLEFDLKKEDEDVFKKLINLEADFYNEKYFNKEFQINSLEIREKREENIKIIKKTINELTLKELKDISEKPGKHTK